MKEQCKGLELFEIVTVIKELSSLEAALKWSTHPGSFGNNTYQALRKQVGPGRCRGIGENPAA